MSDNAAIIRRFYTAFQRLDYKTMNDCYSEDIVFSDPIFMVLHGDEVRAMWEMLCKGAKGFSLRFMDIEILDEEYATCNWIVAYNFSKTGRRVVNHCKAYMRLKDGKIVEHSDAFKLSKWMQQALGWPERLFYWSGFMKRAVQKKAKRSLLRYMQKSD